MGFVGWSNEVRTGNAEGVQQIGEFSGLEKVFC